jgi:hypothetical protein
MQQQGKDNYLSITSKVYNFPGLAIPEDSRNIYIGINDNS